MTAPNLENLVPSKAKAWVGLIGSVLSLVIPYVLVISDSLPQPWPLLIGGLVALLTALGIYRAPYKPAGAALAPKAAIPAGVPTDEGVAGTQDNPGTGSKYRNPWR